MKKYVIIVAGGSGVRMGSVVPKQFLLLHGKPVLMHTIDCFFNFDNAIDIILALPSAEVEHWQQLCIEYDFTIQHRVANGGFTRFHSVKNALELVDQKSLIAIHDGVRPLVSHATIERCFIKAEINGTAIPIIDCFESIRKINGNESTAVERDLYKLVQTPQVFNSEILLNAYKQPYLTQFTDDASAVEHNGHSISLVEGNRENIKITTPFDLTIAELFLKQ